MPEERTDALVLRGVDFSETSRIVTFLTPHRGRVACMAKGARRAKSPYVSALDTLNRVEMVLYWKDGRGVQNLGEVVIRDGFPALKRDLEKGAFAAIPAEALLKIAHENEPSETLYAEAVRGLELLSAWPGNARTHATWQLLRLLTLAGFAPMIEVCSKCGSSLSAAPGFAYDSGAVCPACRGDRKLTTETFEAFRALSEAEAACPAIEDSRLVYNVMINYAARQLETSFRSARVIHQMFD